MVTCFFVCVVFFLMKSKVGSGVSVDYPTATKEIPLTKPANQSQTSNRDPSCVARRQCLLC